MRTLSFNVVGQELCKRPGCSFKYIVAGSVGYLKAVFNFYGNDWKGYKIAVSFWDSDGVERAVLLDSRGSCVIPSEALVGDRFYVALVGAKDGHMIKTTKVEVKQEVV